MDLWVSDLLFEDITDAQLYLVLDFVPSTIVAMASTDNADSVSEFSAIGAIFYD